jgi:hypothetical protein
MYIKRYSHINKYFAFVVMVFAVLSGVSDHFSETNTINSKNGNLAYFLNINNLFAQNSGKITTQIFIKRYNAFNEYVQGILPKGIADVFIGAASSILFFAVIYLNNILMQNNIWRKAVF